MGESGFSRLPLFLAFRQNLWVFVQSNERAVVIGGGY